MEICDKADNDCDGKIDNDPVDANTPCGPMEGNEGECQIGVNICTTGTIVCVGSQHPAEEICDALDNDCDGATDEGCDEPEVTVPDTCGCSAPVSVSNAGAWWLWVFAGAWIRRRRTA